MCVSMNAAMSDGRSRASPRAIAPTSAPMSSRYARSGPVSKRGSARSPPSAHRATRASRSTSRTRHSPRRAAQSASPFAPARRRRASSPRVRAALQRPRGTVVIPRARTGVRCEPVATNGARVSVRGRDDQVAHPVALDQQSRAAAAFAMISCAALSRPEALARHADAVERDSAQLAEQPGGERPQALGEDLQAGSPNRSPAAFHRFAGAGSTDVPVGDL